MQHVKDCLDFFWIHLDTPHANHESKKFANCNIEGTFTQIQLHSILVKDIEGFFWVFDVVCPFKALDKHVVDVDVYVLTNLVFEELVDQPLIGDFCIFQIKGITLQQ